MEFQICKFNSIWEWEYGIDDEIDLPKLKSIELGDYALMGSYGTNDNSLTMKSSGLIGLIMRFAFIILSIW